MNNNGIFYIVPTPIGNLEDITLRAINVLKQADIIACEDTRHTGILLKHYQINPSKFISYHEHNESIQSPKLIEQLKAGKNVALVTDAGTPCISDPGFKLVNAASEAGIKIISLPGPTALIPALAGSGFPVNRFKFFGFPPQKKGRKKFIGEVLSETDTAILYESPHRIAKLLFELYEFAEPDREICIAREISKIHEEYIHTTIADARQITSERNLKGEIVVVIRGKSG